VTTGVTDSNRAMAVGEVVFADGLDEPMRTLFFDPQTSGGLFISLPAGSAASLVEALKARGEIEAAVVGEVLGPGGPRLDVVR